MKIESVLKISIIFLLGFFSANIFGYYMVYGLENPFSNFTSLNLLSSNDAPSDFIKENQIETYSDKIVINIQDASISEYSPSGSMKPVLDENSNGIRIKPKSEQDINIGDIITFKQDNLLIVHRVIEKGNDKEGIYFIMKGDNNTLTDGKIRFKDIKYKTIGVIW